MGDTTVTGDTVDFKYADISIPYIELNEDKQLAKVYTRFSAGEIGDAIGIVKYVEVCEDSQIVPEIRENDIICKVRLTMRPDFYVLKAFPKYDFVHDVCSQTAKVKQLQNFEALQDEMPDYDFND